MKISILYHSITGNTKLIGEKIEEGLKKAGVDQVRLMSIEEEIDEAFVHDSEAIIFGTPTYYATMSWQMKKFFDTTKLDFSEKLGACFATARNIGGGSEIAEKDMLQHMLVRGMLVYSAGAAHGAPFTHLGATAILDGDEFQKNRAVVFGERIGQMAMKLFSK
ncbi:MAG: flavodoxin family protein [Clostridiales bacterium]|nr:flavodoxin family protein [Clostridiales bacterium]